MLKLTLALTLVLADSLLAQQPATAASSLPQMPPVSTRYTVLLAGNTAGFQATSVTPDGAHLYHFEFNDRGRGPGIDSRIVLNKQAIPTQIDNTGHDYLKAPVDEHFSFSNGKATWKNKAEQGTKATAAAFYVSDSGAPEEAALLARALLAAPGGKLPLLPGGEASITRRGDLKLEAGGRSLTVVQYGIDGLGLSPTPVWLEPDGAFFAALSGWWVIIREGWESTIPALTKAQDDFSNARAATLAKTLARKPAGALVFVHANLFDAETATLLPRRTVTIKGNSIAAVGEDGKVAIPPGAEVIDATGKTLMPGLWDMHVHLAEDDGLLHMAAGVTSVRDLGNIIDRVLPMRQRFDDGSEIGPRVVLAGIMDGSGPYAGPTKVLVDTEEQARAAVDNYAKLGYVQIKIYSSIKPELVPVIIQQARSHGMRVSGHVPAFMNAQQFVLDGADEIQHMNFIFLNFMFDSVKETRTPARFTAVAQHATEIDPASEQVHNFIQLLKDHKTVVDPTLAVFEQMFTDRPGQMSKSCAAAADRMPVQVRRGFLHGGLPVPDGMDQHYRDSFNQMLKMTRALYDSGIPVVAGTDDLAGFTLDRELELYVEAGIPAPKVLQLATLGAARLMKMDQQLGSIAPGKLAGVIVIDGDPVSRISDIRRVETIVKDGVVYKSAELYRAVGVGSSN